MAKNVPKAKRDAPTIPKHIPQQNRFRPPSGADGCLRIRLTYVDVGGPFCLTGIEQSQFRDLLGRLKSLEQMQASKVFGQGSTLGKVYAVERLPNKQARDRLVELNYDDETEIARLEITGRRRLYGFLSRDSCDFWALWWDPEHVIWPSPKKHT